MTKIKLLYAVVFKNQFLCGHLLGFIFLSHKDVTRANWIRKVNILSRQFQKMYCGAFFSLSIVSIKFFVSVFNIGQYFWIFDIKKCAWKGKKNIFLFGGRLVNRTRQEWIHSKIVLWIKLHLCGFRLFVLRFLSARLLWQRQSNDETDRSF